METYVKTLLPQVDTDTSGEGESRSATALSFTESGGGTLRLCVSGELPEKSGVDFVPATDCEDTEKGSVVIDRERTSSE